jgi:GTP diphosphokinase / guanosine-3',5'-bis(diphosphate) 3'-diphosphatase
MTLALDAMIFARRVHTDQVRKYTGNPYADHLAEVAGIVSTVLQNESVIAIAWLHDCMEDQHVSHDELKHKFGSTVADGVAFLSDMEEGNRAERKAASRARLAMAPPWIQTVKVADLISNTSSIVMHDPKFAETYLEEKRLLLDVLIHANPHLLRIAREQAS